MNVYLAPPAGLSRAMARVACALADHAPDGVRVVTDRNRADLVFLHTIGFPETERAIEEITANGQDVAIIQYCLRSTQKPHTRDWLPLWQRATVVWSYYDLDAACKADGVTPEYCNFHLSPLGIDPEFRIHPAFMDDATFTNRCPRDAVMSSGYVSGPNSEAIEEWMVAGKHAGLKLLHLGPTVIEGVDPSMSAWFRTLHGMSDQHVARFYESCRYVSGLRHKEGFELPVVEGLACGARPIVFDRPEMRMWFDDHAIFVPECHGAKLVDQLIEIFDRPFRSISADEQREIHTKFDWKTIVTAVYRSIDREK